MRILFVLFALSCALLAAGQTPDAHAEVTKIDKAGGKRHAQATARSSSLDMPPMTMVFRVARPGDARRPGRGRPASASRPTSAINGQYTVTADAAR